jgi:hypothetical protein
MNCDKRVATVAAPARMDFLAMRVQIPPSCPLDSKLEPLVRPIALLGSQNGSAGSRATQGGNRHEASWVTAQTRHY